MKSCWFGAQFNDGKVKTSFIGLHEVLNYTHTFCQFLCTNRNSKRTLDQATEKSVRLKQNRRYPWTVINAECKTHDLNDQHGGKWQVQINALRGLLKVTNCTVFEKRSDPHCIAVAYAENIHVFFIQWHMVVICIWCAHFVTSQFDVIFMFPNQRFGEVRWHNMHIRLHTLPIIYISLNWI